MTFQDTLDAFFLTEDQDAFAQSQGYADREQMCYYEDREESAMTDREMEAFVAREEAIAAWKGISDPITMLLKALYGHNDSVTLWEFRCDSGVKSVGFRAIGAEWPSVYYHDELQLLLVIYVEMCLRLECSINSSNHQ